MRGGAPMLTMAGQIRTIFDLDQMEVLEMSDASMLFSNPNVDEPIDPTMVIPIPPVRQQQQQNMESWNEDTLVEEDQFNYS